jgi:hypothetical protein
MPYLVATAVLIHTQKSKMSCSGTQGAEYWTAWEKKAKGAWRGKANRAGMGFKHFKHRTIVDREMEVNPKEYQET